MDYIGESTFGIPMTFPQTKRTIKHLRMHFSFVGQTSQNIPRDAKIMISLTHDLYQVTKKESNSVCRWPPLI